MIDHCQLLVIAHEGIFDGRQEQIMMNLWQSNVQDKQKMTNGKCTVNDWWSLMENCMIMAIISKNPITVKQWFLMMGKKENYHSWTFINHHLFRWPSFPSQLLTYIPRRRDGGCSTGRCCRRTARGTAQAGLHRGEVQGDGHREGQCVTWGNSKQRGMQKGIMGFLDC